MTLKKQELCRHSTSEVENEQLTGRMKVFVLTVKSCHDEKMVSMCLEVLEVVVVVVCSEDGIVWMGKVQKWEQQMMLVLA